MGDQRRKKTVWSSLVTDPYRKLAAVALAVGLWYFLDAQVTKDWTVTATLRVTNEAVRTAIEPEPGHNIMVRLPTQTVAVRGFKNAASERPIDRDTVQLVFRGPRHLVDSVRDNQLTLFAGPFLDRKWDEITALDFTAAEIRRTDRTLQDLEISMDPPVVRVELEQKSVRDVPLKADVVELLWRDPQHKERLHGRLRMDRVEFNRDFCQVRGPRSLMRAFPNPDRRPFAVQLEPINGERQATGVLTLNGGDGTLELGTQATITIELVPNHREFSLDIQVRVDDRSLPPTLQGKYRPVPPIRQVKIKASGELGSLLVPMKDDPEALARFAHQFLRLDVWIPPRDDEEGFAPNLVREARLVLLGPLGDRLDPINYGLAEAVSVDLVRN